MKIYITFGQVHAHSVNGRTFDKDCVAVIKCSDHNYGRALAFKYFGDRFCTSYDTLPNMSYYPRGLIAVN